MNKVWQKSDKYTVFMLLWMISGTVVTSKVFAVVFSIIGMIYGAMTLYHTFKGE